MSTHFNSVEITANMYSEMRGEAREHARLRNAYFEQVWPYTCDVHCLSLSEC